VLYSIVSNPPLETGGIQYKEWDRHFNEYSLNNNGDNVFRISSMQSIPCL